MTGCDFANGINAIGLKNTGCIFIGPICFTFFAAGFILDLLRDRIVLFAISPVWAVSVLAATLG